MGKIDGGTASTVLNKSNLSPQILAQVWALSDIDKDGMLTDKEFSIAMRLTRNCIAGIPLPPVLPASLHQIPSMNASFSTPSAPVNMTPNPMNMMNMSSPNVMGTSPMSYGAHMNQATPPYQPNQLLQHRPSVPGPPPSTYSSGKQCGNWIIPHNHKLRYSQQFNQLDKQRVGFLSGQAGRSALGMSGLPTPLLAHIWSLADVNKDGKLSVDEFCIAMHMIDMSKNGFALPDITPAELTQMCGLSRSANNSPQLEPGAPPAQKSPAPKTFEDKRMDNFAKGQAELERRRQILMEEEHRRRAEIEKREREEMEKRERERLEKERQREAERQAELERMRQQEEVRLEHERIREAEREKARKEAEKQRLVELEKARVKALQNQKQQEMEKGAQRQQRQKTLGFQLQALDEKTTDLNSEVTQAKEKITEITKSIERMREARDEKLTRIHELQVANQALSVQAQELAHQLLQLQSANKETSTRKAELGDTVKRLDHVRSVVENMKEQLKQSKERTANQSRLHEEKKGEIQGKRSELSALREEYQKLLTKLNTLQTQARSKLNESGAVYAEPPSEEMKQSIMSNSGHTDLKSNGMSASLPNATTTGTTKYRAIFEFVARTEDELSFQPGDVILVFEGHASEPGWRAGQIKEKVGWFPEAFAEPIGAVTTSIAQPIQNMPPNVTPSPSLDRIPEESVVKTAAPIVEEQPNTCDPVICTCVAQFPWKARNEGDLSFAKGDIIEVIKQQEMKWCGKKTDGTTGWFPKSYVKVQSNSKPASFSQSFEQATPAQGSPSTPQQSFASSRQASVASVTASATATAALNSAIQSLAASSPQSPQKKASDWYVALFEFEAVEPTDLSLAVGDKILVVEQNESWWKGKCNGKTGIFPANYVEKLDPEATPVAQSPSHYTVLCRVRVVADFKATADNQLSVNVGDIISVREKSDSGWWEGETVRDGNPIAGWFPGDYVVPIEEVDSGAKEITATALFDYTAGQTDELTFSTGEIIIIDNKDDGEWWTGHKAGKPNQKGLFPASYVQLSTAPSLYAEPPSLYELPPIETPIPRRTDVPALYDFPPTPGTYETAPMSALYEEPPVMDVFVPTDKFLKLKEEMITTEERYLGDLVLAKKLFYQNLINVVRKADLNAVFLNWDSLIEQSKKMLTRMKRNEPIGSLFLNEISSLSVFVEFCKKQQSALEAIPILLKSPDARAIYAQCCASTHARGMTLNYFIMIPLGRVTRYPLLVEKMLKETNKIYVTVHQDLDYALQLLRALVSEVNQAVKEMDTVSLLCWAQQHVRCPSLHPPIEFTSKTRSLGSRSYLHSGVLYKVRSGKLLVGILFNDFLILCTPDETISDPDSFKISRSLDVKLTLYKQPYLLGKLSLELIKDNELQFIIKYGDESVHLRCQSRNATKMWTKEIQQAIDLHDIAMSELENNRRLVSSTVKGRLLIEILSIQNVNGKNVGSPPHLFHLTLGPVTEKIDADLSKQDLGLTSQFPFSSIDSTLHIALYQKRLFCPDIPVLEQATVTLRDLINETSKLHGPITKKMRLRTGTHGKNTETVIVKFAVQLFQSDM
ncbi:unnamed protein product [Auanema sp. JU1783]|nr:unnamed protein product [Auanema sp. JU1783]